MAAIIVGIFLNLVFVTPAQAQPSCSLIVGRKHQFINANNFGSRLKFFKFEDMKVPFIELKPAPSQKRGETVLLVSGFGKNMRSWMTHMNILRQKGYRVLAMDLSNVGYNLLENGMRDFDNGEGISLDVALTKAFIKKQKLAKSRVVGHSRGAYVAAKALFELQGDKSIKGVHKLVLLSPYVRYFWKSNIGGPFSYFFDQWLSFFMESNPALIGKKLGETLRSKESAYHKFEKIEGLTTDEEDLALGHLLKGTKPKYTFEEVSTVELVEVLKEEMGVRVVGGDKDHDLAPEKIVSELDLEDVDFVIEEGFDHFWPQRYPLHAVNTILAD